MLSSVVILIQSTTLATGGDNWTYGGVTIFIDDDNDGVLDSGERSTTTGTNGVWSIGGLTLADVGKSIREVLPSGSVQTGTLVQTIENPGSGGTDTGNNFTNFRNFSISGQKFEDYKGDGQDLRNWTYGGVTIFIDDDNDGVLDSGERSTTTGTNGVWSIGGLTLADVGKSIREVLPSGSVQTGTLVQTIENPGSGGTDMGNDFTNFRNFSISGQKFEDLTGDGKTNDDIPWSGNPVTIYIDANNNNVLDSGERSTTTGTNGTWSIDGLTLADVGKSIREVVPSGSVQTGTLVQIIDNPGSGGTDTDNDFTNFKPTGPGVGTPGFWKQWTAIWDGNTSNDSTFNTKANFAKADILLNVTDQDSTQPGPQVIDPVTGTAQTGILIGDFNKNGITDAGEKTIFYTVAEAQAILNSSVSNDGQDARYSLDKQLIASWLNVLAGNSYFHVKTDINNAIVWLQNATPNEGGTSSGDGKLDGTTKLPSSDLRWSTKLGSVSGTQQHYGVQIKDVLDYYNNTGAGLAIDRDTGVVGGSTSNLATLQLYQPYF